MAIVGFFQEHESKPKILSREFYGNLPILYSKVYRSSIGKLQINIWYKVFMCILNSFTEVDILYFGCMEFKILFDFHKKVKTLSCYFEKNLDTLLSFTLKKVFASLHSAPALLYSKFFNPPDREFEKLSKPRGNLNFCRKKLKNSGKMKKM